MKGLINIITQQELTDLLHTRTDSLSSHFAAGYKKCILMCKSQLHGGRDVTKEWLKQKLNEVSPFEKIQYKKGFKLAVNKILERID